MYNVNCNKSDDGSYTLSYGKSGKKLTARLDNDNGRWQVTVQGYSADAKSTKREAVETWGVWAAASYGGASPQTPQEVGGTSSSTYRPPAHALEVVTKIEADPVPELDQLFQTANVGVIQELIDEAPTRDDQIRRWFKGYITRGFEFRLPQTTRTDYAITNTVTETAERSSTRPAFSTGIPPVPPRKIPPLPPRSVRSGTAGSSEAAA